MIQQDLKEHLQKEVTADEIKAAAFQMAPLKAPGPDGFPGIFFQKYWDDIGGSVTKAVQSFFTQGILNPSLNKTAIVLIPKIPHPEKVTQFRPISLCNYCYKIIYRVLVNRLKSHMNQIISPQQNAFVKGRQI